MKKIHFLYAAMSLALGCGGAPRMKAEGSIGQEAIFTARPNVGLDFVGGGANGTPEPLASDEIAGAIPYQFWRSVTGGSGTETNVNTSDGFAAEIQVQWSSAAPFSTGIADNGGNSRMMKGYLNTDNTSTTTVTFSNLPASGVPGEFGYATADVYVYFDGSNLAADRTGMYTLTTGSQPSRTISGKDAAGVQFSGTFTPVTVSGGTGNFINFSKVPLADTLTITATPGASTDASRRAPINAIQIIPDADGGDPTASLVQASNGAFFGVNASGGPYGRGTAFSITPAGQFTLLHSFGGPTGSNPPDGANPTTRLDIGPDGNFYGTTDNGGTAGLGVVFKMTPSGTVTLLHEFTGGADDSRPTGRLIVGSDGALYGTTLGAPFSNGSIYRITRDGAFSTIFTFAADGSQGRNPTGGVKVVNGTLFGTAQFGGPGSNGGVVFRVSQTGTGFAILHAFNGADGSSPNNKLTLGADGKLYGTTDGGSPNLIGTVYSITIGGAFTNLFTFTNVTIQGARPKGELLRASDNTLYGVTSDGGTNGGGTVFKITNGVVTPNFFSFPAEFRPSAGLFQGTDGNLYGVALGNDKNLGSAYRLTTSKVLTVLRSF